MVETVNGTLLHRLVAARRSGVPIESLPAASLPQSPREAYGVAAALIRELGRSPNGYKIGANTARAQQMLGLAEPLYGRTFTDGTTRLAGRHDTLGGEAAVEAEIVLRLRHDLEKLPIHRQGWRAAIDEVMVGIEINQPSYRDALAMGGLAIIADNGVHAGLVLGASRSVSGLDELVDIPMRLQVDGAGVQEGSARSAGIDPWQALAWLASNRLDAGEVLRAGEWIATGAIVSCGALRGGTHIRVCIGDGVECELSLV